MVISFYFLILNKHKVIVNQTIQSVMINEISVKCAKSMIFEDLLFLDGISKI